jgi:hypothetical protein
MVGEAASPGGRVLWGELEIKAPEVWHKRNPIRGCGGLADLTKKQRQGETGMQDEAVKRNMELSSEHRAKNLVWAMIGCKRDSRLVKRFAAER